MDWFEANQRSHGAISQIGKLAISKSANLPISQFRNLPIWQSGNFSMPKICDNLPDFPGLVLVWVEAKFCNKIRNGQFLPRSTRSRAFAPLRVEKFSKRSAKKSTASPKIRQNLTQTCKMQGLVLGWMEAIFCNKIRSGQLLPKTTRSPSFCTAPRREIFETVGEEVDSFAEISESLRKTCNLAGARSRLYKLRRASPSTRR